MCSKTPYAVDVEEGTTYYWCACGRSKNQPFCDGSHEGTDFQPVAFTAEKSEKVYLCGCKKQQINLFVMVHIIQLAEAMSLMVYIKAIAVSVRRAQAKEKICELIKSR